MSEAETIAKKLTAAQVRALRDPMIVEMSDWWEFCKHPMAGKMVFFMGDDFGHRPEPRLTDLGLAVLAALPTP